MRLTAVEATTMLQSLATQAQTAGLVPGGTPTLLLSLLTAGLQTALVSGVLVPSTSIELEDIGMEFEAAVVRMRVALAQGGG